MNSSPTICELSVGVLFYQQNAFIATSAFIGVNVNRASFTSLFILLLFLLNFNKSFLAGLISILLDFPKKISSFLCVCVCAVLHQYFKNVICFYFGFFFQHQFTTTFFSSFFSIHLFNRSVRFSSNIFYIYWCVCVSVCIVYIDRMV